MTSSILVINCGSSSIKFAHYAQKSLSQPDFTALAERLGEDQPLLTFSGVISAQFSLPAAADHQSAMRVFIDHARTHLAQLVGIGHRVVHGGELFHSSTLMTETEIATLEKISALAPLHNPINLLGIHLCRELFPGVPQVAVFDTAFHQTLDEATYLYGVPYDWYQQDNVRRYGFHGTSYRYVSQEAARRLQKPTADLNLLIAHLGNGCSACAIRAGQSVDSTMGLTPLEGLVMGSRCGDIDPGLLEHMMRSRQMTVEQIMHDLNRNSGMKGLSGLSNDMRTLLDAETNGHEGARRAIDVFCFRVARQFAALSVSLPHTDAVIFTGGIGEHAAPVRRRILAAWRAIKFSIDSTLNQQHGDAQGVISQPDSPRVMVIPTDEEGMIALDTLNIISASAENNGKNSTG